MSSLFSALAHLREEGQSLEKAPVLDRREIVHFPLCVVMCRVRFEKERIHIKQMCKLEN